MVNGTRLLYTRRFSIFIPPRRDDISNDTSNLYPVFNWTHFKIYLSRSIPFVSNIIPNSITSGNCKSAITPVHLPSRENLVLGKQFSTRGVEETRATETMRNRIVFVVNGVSNRGKETSHIAIRT